MKHWYAIIAPLGGIFCILACIFDWDFFFENSRARFFVNLFGRKGARIFYTILGLVLLGIGIGLMANGFG